MKILQTIKNIVRDLFPKSEWSFSPITHSSYNIADIDRTDYLRLYTWRQYLAVSTIANTIWWLEKRLTRWENDIEHPHLQLISYEMIVQMVSSLQLSWTAYYYINRVGRTIVWLDYLRTDWVRIEENVDGSLKWYRYLNNRKQFLFAPEDILDISLYNPLQTYPYKSKWVSPMQAVAMQAEMDITATRRNRNYFKNWWSVGDILSTETSLPDEVKQRMYSMRRNKFQWVNNSHRLAILDNNIKYQSIGGNQKEMDFVESRRFTRDEVLAIYKVPKSVVWIVEDVNRANAEVAQQTYREICILPLCKMIERYLNKNVFNWIWEFSFEWVTPDDNQKYREDFVVWAITQDEYREIIWYSPLNEQEQDEVLEDSKTFKVLQKYTKGTKERREEREKQGNIKHKRFIQRADKFEIKFVNIVKEVFENQKRDMVSKLTKNKKAKVPKQSDLRNITKRMIALSPLYKEIMVSEWNEALKEIWVVALFQPWEWGINKRITDNIRKMWKEIDDYTVEKLANVIKESNELWLWAQDIANNITKVFDNFTETRALKIARTEVVRASNQATIEAREQTWLVQGKERFTAEDERTCEFCNSLHGKIVKSNKGNFFNKGEELKIGDKKLKFDYESIKWAPLHPNCRCTLLPII